MLSVRSSRTSNLYLRCKLPARLSRAFSVYRNNKCFRTSTVHVFKNLPNLTAPGCSFVVSFQQLTRCLFRGPLFPQCLVLACSKELVLMRNVQKSEKVAFIHDNSNVQIYKYCFNCPPAGLTYTKKDVVIMPNSKSKPCMCMVPEKFELGLHSLIIRPRGRIGHGTNPDIDLHNCTDRGLGAKWNLLYTLFGTPLEDKLILFIIRSPKKQVEILARTT